MVLAPTHASARAEEIRNACTAVHDGGGGLEDPGHGYGARFVREDERVLGGQRVRVLGAVVDHEAAGRLRVEPLADVALVRVGARRELLGADGPAIRHRAIEAELVPYRDEGRVQGRPDLG